MTTPSTREPTTAHGKGWWLLLALALWVLAIVAASTDLGGHGDVWAVPAAVPFVVGLLWLWRWEQGRKRRGAITYGEDLTRAALTGPVSLLAALIRGPRRPTRVEHGPRVASPAAPPSARPTSRAPVAASTAPPPTVAVAAGASAAGDLSSGDGLRRFLESVASAQAMDLRPPCAPARLAAAEVTLGRPLPTLLRRVLAISGGLRRDVLLDLGEANASLVEGAPERAGRPTSRPRRPRSPPASSATICCRSPSRGTS